MENAYKVSLFISLAVSNSHVTINGIVFWTATNLPSSYNTIFVHLVSDTLKNK